MISGCLKARIDINVYDDDSGNLSFSLGMTSEAKSLFSAESVDPIEELSQAWSYGDDTTVSTRRWRGGGYDWVEVSTPFETLDELNQNMNDFDLFSEFNLTKQSNLVKNRYVLKSTFSPQFENDEYLDSTLFDPSNMFEFELSVRLPGRLVQSNGIHDEDLDALVWSFSKYSEGEINAVSETWNWLNIGVITGGVVLASLFFIIGIIFVAFGIYKNRITNESAD